MDHTQRAANAYKSAQVDAAVLGATPYELVETLLAKAIESTKNAKQHMLKGEIIAKGEQIKLATAIIADGLRGSLNMEEGGEIAANLNVLYEYMLERLMAAHAKNDPDMLDEVVTLLGQIKQGWEGIKPHQNAQAEL
jgi:flagellar protein FliS